jgi:hypothetical protein
LQRLGAELNDKVAALEKDVGALSEKAKSIPALKAPLSRLQQTTEDARALSAKSSDASAAVSTALSRHPYSFVQAPSIVLNTTTERSE